MNPVDWLQNLLHSINPTWVWIGLGYLACLFAIMKLMQAKGMADRRQAVGLRKKLTGPQVTAKTLMEDRHTNKDKETTE